jgi:hypothetical protein
MATARGCLSAEADALRAGEPVPEHAKDVCPVALEILVNMCGGAIDASAGLPPSMPQRCAQVVLDAGALSIVAPVLNSQQHSLAKTQACLLLSAVLPRVPAATASAIAPVTDALRVPLRSTLFAVRANAAMAAGSIVASLGDAALPLVAPLTPDLFEGLDCPAPFVVSHSGVALALLASLDPKPLMSLVQKDPSRALRLLSQSISSAPSLASCATAAKTLLSVLTLDPTLPTRAAGGPCALRPPVHPCGRLLPCRCGSAPDRSSKAWVP